MLDESPNPQEFQATASDAPVAPAAEAPNAPGRGSPGHGMGARPVDFRAATPLGAPAQRQLRLRHEECARALATRLSIYLRVDLHVTLSVLEPVRCRAWLDRLAEPTHLTLFSLNARPGLGVLEVPQQLGLILVDRLLGGTGEPEQVGRGLSEIEISVLDEVVQIVLREWCQHLLLPEPHQFSLIGHESNSRFVQAAPDESPLLALAWDFQLFGQQQRLQMGVPFALLEPLLSSFAADPAPETPVAQHPPPSPTWNAQFDHVQLPLTAQCEGFEVSARRLASLRVGDVLPIEPAFLNRVQIRLARIPKFVGRLGRQGDLRAVELTAAIPK